MKKVLLILFVLFSLAFLVYVVMPSPSYPEPPQDALQSDEPADVEDTYRRAYFTNLTREEVIAHYRKEFNRTNNLPTLRLNYPPEESQTIIRDQTRSTFLEELAHPFRENLFINGFEPKDEKDEINVGDQTWRQKIIVKYVPSSIYVRFLVAILTLAAIYLLVREYTYVKKQH